MHMAKELGPASAARPRNIDQPLSRAPVAAGSDGVVVHLEPRPAPVATHAREAVQFYADEDTLAGMVARFAVDGLAAAETVLLIATSARLDAFRRRAREMGHDLAAAAAAGRVVTLDARATLASILVDGAVDRERFHAEVGGAIARLGAAAGGRRVRAYGEMGELLWGDGRAADAMRIEELWVEVRARHTCALLRAYSLARAVDLADTEVGRDEHGEGGARLRRGELLDFIENAAVPMRSVDAEGRVLWANRAELELLGQAREEYVGRPVAEHFADADVAQDMLDRLRRSETLRQYPARMRRKDGSIRHVVIDSNVRTRDGVFVHTRCCTRDVTADVDARDEHAARERFRELFIGVLGHDLRTPLGAITAGAQVLAMRGAQHDGRRLDESSALIVARISRSAARMARMIDQVLDFARLNAGNGIPLDRQPMDLADVCATAIDELQAQHPGRTIEVGYVGNTAGCWDLDRLSQVFSNLLGNALAYGDPSAPIRICVADDQGDVVVNVHNMGPPIPPDVMPAIFDPFRRARPKQPGDRGVGLGLFITQQIVRGHGGTIDVRSTAEEGTTFCLRLPRRSPVTPPAA